MGKVDFRSVGQIRTLVHQIALAKQTSSIDHESILMETAVLNQPDRAETQY